MSSDNGKRIIAPGQTGPVVITEKVQIKRPHAFNCGNCARWDKLKEDAGVCRLHPPQIAVIGVGEGMDRSPRPVTAPLFNITGPNEVCAFHPELLGREMVNAFTALFQAWKDLESARLTWDREKGFNRAPSLAEARQFVVAELGDAEGKPG